MEQIKKTKEDGENEKELVLLKQEIIEKYKKIKELKEETDELKRNIKKKDEIITKKNEIIKKMETDLIHDELTGLKSKRYFMEKAQDDISAISAPESEKRKEGFKDISFLFCDIDDFKKVNDIYGHLFGNEILKEIARLLETNIRDSDTVCRWGGDEITISLLGVDEKEALEKAEGLRKAVEEGINQKYGNNPEYSDLKTSLSIGISPFESGLSFDELINRGDKAMYLAKEEGGNRVKTYSQVLEKEK